MVFKLYFLSTWSVNTSKYLTYQLPSVFYFCLFVTGILIFSCYRKDRGMVESVSLTFFIFMLIETLRVNQVVWALGLPVLMHYVSAHSSPHKEIFALYSFFLCDGKMMCLLCMIYCAAVSTKKVYLNLLKYDTNTASIWDTMLLCQLHCANYTCWKDFIVVFYRISKH